MSSISAVISIDVPDGKSVEDVVRDIQTVISSMTGSETRINVVESDNPLSLSPINLQRLQAKKY